MLVLYLDDIVGFSNTFEEHLVRVCEVLQSLQDAGLKLKSKKYHLCVSILGHHVIDASGIHTDPAKIMKIRDLK